jgi:type IV pilus assembly protein PilZ
LSTPKSEEERSAMAVAGGDDRRRHERLRVDLEVDYRAADTFLFAYITDISVMGIFICTAAPEAPGTRLNLRFSHPAGDAFELEGEVIWINPPPAGELLDDGEAHFPGMGVRFVDLDDEQRGRVLDLVRTFAYLADPDEDRTPQ